MVRDNGVWTRARDAVQLADGTVIVGNIYSTAEFLVFTRGFSGAVRDSVAYERKWIIYHRPEM